HAFFDGAAEQNQGRGAEHGDQGEEDEQNTYPGVAVRRAIARNVVGGVEAIDQAFDYAGCGPQREDSRNDDESGGPLAAITKLVKHCVFGTWRQYLREEDGDFLAYVIGANLDGDCGG